MCGIAGIISSQKGFINRTLRQRMSDALAEENNIKVLLDGQWADETLAGYTK